MALVEVLMPQMGESVMEGTILSWLKQVGDTIEEEESLLEVATDKVDTEIPSPFGGTIKEILVKEGDVVQINTPIARIETEASAQDSTPQPLPANEVPSEVPFVPEETTAEPTRSTEPITPTPTSAPSFDSAVSSGMFLNKKVEGRFLSPLVLNIAKKESIALSELDWLAGTGKEGRVTKKDILAYVKAGKPSRTAQTEAAASITPTENKVIEQTNTKEVQKPESTAKSIDINELSEAQIRKTYSVSGDFEIQEMDRMRKIISERMIESRKTSAHVTSFVEADVTNIVYWRNRVKQEVKERDNVILTYTPIFIEAVAKAIKDYPLMNVSVAGDKIIVKKDINIGLAVALPDGNLIVPVIKNADQLNIIGLTKKVNELAKKARNGKLSPEELEGGTYTVSNVGSFGNVMGTPILVQPQVGILALGAVQKKPAVIETEYGDTIGIRHMMFLSHSYDHRIVDGSLGGMFVRRVADYLERFDLNRKLP